MTGFSNNVTTASPLLSAGCLGHSPLWGGPGIACQPQESL